MMVRGARLFAARGARLECCAVRALSGAWRAPLLFAVRGARREWRVVRGARLEWRVGA